MTPILRGNDVHEFAELDSKTGSKMLVSQPVK